MGRQVILGPAYTLGRCKVTIQVECCCCTESYSETWEYMPYQPLWYDHLPYEWLLVNGCFYCPTCSHDLQDILNGTGIEEL